MSDIVKRLRAHSTPLLGWPKMQALLAEAANEIELLRKGLEFEKRLNHERLERGAEGAASGGHRDDATQSGMAGNDKEVPDDRYR